LIWNLAQPGRFGVRGPRPGAIDERAKAADEQMLDALQRSAFQYFLDHSNADNGLAADATREGAPSSIAAVGFALSAYPIGIERGWIARADAVARVLQTLRFLAASNQSGSAQSTGYRGFYFHFLDMHSGARVWESELSIIDSALLLAGVLAAAAYFTAATPAESQLRALADALYRRADWRWAQNDGAAITHGWKPECGFLNYGWDGYSEAIILYALALGSHTHPPSDDSYRAWGLTYQWENLYDQELLYAGPIFVHQLSHAWIDFRGIRDGFMREKKCDYFENSRRATFVQQGYARRNPRSFTGYAADCFGLSAGEGPRASAQTVAGRQQPFFAYAARGVPYGPDDGTLAGPGVLASLPFAPEVVLPTVRRLYDPAAPEPCRRLLASGFNPTCSVDANGDPDPAGWVSPGRLGFDQGLALMMIENHRSGLPWQLGRRCDYLRIGLRRAGFRGGWL
jgi:hypothetical protein